MAAARVWVDQWVGVRSCAPWLVVAALLGGCGRTRSDCDDCNAALGGSGGLMHGGAGGSPGGAAGASVGGQAGGGQVTATCDVGAPLAPLVRYSSTDLEWSMDALVGPGPALVHSAGERFDEGSFRATDSVWVRSLLDSVEARVAAAPLNAASWTDCDDAAMGRPDCASVKIAELGMRIYRRPLAQAELDGYLAQFRALAATSPEDGARAVVTSMLLSPNFVFRIERGEGQNIALTIAPPAPAGEPPAFPQPSLPTGIPLNAFEIAARLSHFVTRQAPDKPLLDMAIRGALFTAEERAQEAKRLLGTPQGKRARVLQHLEWLAIDTASSEPELVAMKAQTSAFIADVLENREGSFLELLTSARQPLNLELAQYYGVEASVGDAFTFVELDPMLYAGVLGQGLWLTQQRGPTNRGLSVQERLLCTTIPPHPVELPSGNFIGSTPRERIVNATSESPVCAACHAQMDPIGFALEAFDDAGRLTGFDTTGSITLEGSPTALSGPAALGGAVATSDKGRYCAAQRSVEYLLDRKAGDENELSLFACLLSPFAGGRLDLNELARQVAASSAMTRIQQPGTIALGASRETEPLAHASEECQHMSAGSTEPERSTLDAYCQRLAALAAEAGREP